MAAGRAHARSRGNARDEPQGPENDTDDDTQSQHGPRPSEHTPTES
jgi:hypothetical protein